MATSKDIAAFERQIEKNVLLVLHDIISREAHDLVDFTVANIAVVRRHGQYRAFVFTSFYNHQILEDCFSASLVGAYESLFDASAEMLWEVMNAKGSFMDEEYGLKDQKGGRKLQSGGYHYPHPSTIVTGFD